MILNVLGTYGPFAVLVIFLVVTVWLGNKARDLGTEEFTRNDDYDAPSDRQVRWHIRHLREDMRLLIITLTTTNLLLLIVAMVAVSKL